MVVEIKQGTRERGQVRSVALQQILDVLGYAGSPNYRLTSDQHDPLTAHLFRSAQMAGAEGAYVFHTSPNDELLPVRPAVYIAEARTTDEAREIHRNLWNLGNAPFLIILLPHQVRVYTGFDYDQQNNKRGLLETIDLLQALDLGETLASYKADSIDSGRLWKDQAEHLRPEHRVDTQLLNNLTKLEEALVRDNLDLPTAHALIGKYVYIRYLYDRKILSSQWLDENGIPIASVFGRDANLKGLRKLVEALDERFNGQIFPFPLSGKNAPTNDHVSLVAAAFKGDDPVLRQMHLDFEPYNFSYIPIETLSSIYEQFLRSQGTGKRVGAVYTPEPLADYLLAEMNSVKPLAKGMRILDPCCGSGIFLVLAYRKLIETELLNRPDQKLRPTELREILTESIHGVERNADACYVAELSLILTMLHYIAPPDLHRNKQFRFPDLHNRQIFEADFFDGSSEFWEKEERFDWIIGNPPWIEPEKNSDNEQQVLAWINDKENRRQRPVAGNRVAEAFSWRAAEMIEPDGCIGLIVHATSLFNHESKKYRREFFKQHEVLRITNFTNLAYVLFSGRGEAPAATMIYRQAQPHQDKAAIVHYGPFVINQVLNRPWKESKKQVTWVLTVNENEIQTVSPDEAEEGNAVTWKLALWGGHRDRRALQRLRKLFTTTLEELAGSRGWHLHEGVRLMECPPYSEQIKYEVETAPELKGRKFFDAAKMISSGRRFSIPVQALQDIPEHLCFVRKRSGQSSLREAKAAHLIFNAAYSVFTDHEFIIRSPDKRLSVPSEDADELRALSLFSSSSIVQYYLFFLSPAWGVDRNRVYARDIKQIPVPTFTQQQINELAELQKYLVAEEISDRDAVEELQEILDEGVERILNVPKNLSILAKDFMKVRLSLNKGKVTGAANHPPQEEDLYSYGQSLRDELDEFTKGRVRHDVSFTYSSSQSLVVCEVKVVDAAKPLTVTIHGTGAGLSEVLNKIAQKLKQQFSQWVYVQRGLRIFDDSKVYICKPPRLIDWTQTQALNDSDDLIAEVLAGRNRNQEVVMDAAG